MPINPDSENKQTAKTRAENKNENVRQDGRTQRKKAMEIAVAAASTIAVIVWILFGIAAFKQSESGVIWTAYIAITFTLLAFALTWQKRVGEREVKTSTPEPTLTERPWLSVEIVPNGPFLFSRDRNVSGKAIIKNAGNSVANQVTFRVQVFPMSQAELLKEPLIRQKVLCEKVPSEFARKSGVAIFPDKSYELPFSGGAGTLEEINAHRTEITVDRVQHYGIIPVLVGCVDYSFGDKPWYGQTSFIYSAHRSNPTNPDAPLFIEIGQDVPADRLWLEKYFLGGGDAK